MSRNSSLAIIGIVTPVVLLVSLAIAYLIGWQSIKANQAILDHWVVTEQLNELISAVREAESAQRGFLLTGDQSYLASFGPGSAAARAGLANLPNLERLGGLSSDDVAILTRLVNTKLSELAQTIALRHAQGPAAALRLVESDYGKDVIDELRTRVGAITKAQEIATQQAHDNADAMVAWRNLVFTLAAVINLAVLFWAYCLLKRESEQREAVATELRRQKDFVEVTLASIGDGVIVTDSAGRLTSLNGAAENLTGWTNAEAVGLPCATVFHIVNESTRELVESPVAKVLQTGVIAGLANHTVLIRRDGGEIPIDDSGSPIREADGQLGGVVLVFRNVEMQRKAQLQMMEANSALKAAGEAKDQFLAALSHELRTPLTPVLAVLSMWEASDELPEPLLADIRMLRRNVDLEARLIDDLLDLTRIAKGKLSINLELVDLHEILGTIVDMYQSAIHTKGIKLDVSLMAKRFYVKADPARMQQIFGNIANNATKFTPDGGHIEIASSNDSAGHINLSIVDSGIGMDADTLDRLFEPFEQGRDGGAEKYGGLGLGMAIAKALVEAHVGTISASSAGPGLGSTVTVSLPAVDAMLAAVGASRTVERASNGAPREAALLIVEDHEDTAEVIARLLRNRGYRVETCGTVAAALELMRGQHFDLLVSDIGLPDGTGLDLIRELRRDFAIPAIALTGFGADADKARYSDAGFNANLTKPVNFYRLEGLIGQLLSANN